MKEFYSNLYVGKKSDYYSYILDLLLCNKKKFIITANTETFMMGLEDKEIYDMLTNRDNSIIADGIGLVKGAKINGLEIEERITGVDTVKYLLDECSKFNKSLFIFGCKEEVLTKMKEVIKKDYSGINVVGMINGYVSNKDQVFSKAIKEAKPDVILVALGVPLQEKLINKHINEFDKGIFIGVGGSIDVLSGSIRRAPNVFIKTNTEWLYRIMTRPSRIKKFFKYNVRFLLKSIFSKKDM